MFVKSWTNECLVVIPCLNEQDRIGQLVRRVRSQLPHVCVIDDGSVDHTGREALLAGAHVLRNPVNRGKGYSLKSGWQYGLDQRFSWVLMLDGDGQHSPDDIPAFLRAAENTNADLIIGNRMGEEKSMMPFGRRLVNQWMSRWISKRVGMVLPDTQCGFRLLNLQSVQLCGIEADHYEIESDLLLHVVQRRGRVVFVPIRVLYGSEQSKINPLADTLRWLRWWKAATRELETNCHESSLSRS